MTNDDLAVLQSAVTRYADGHANADGLALTPVPGLRMMRVAEPRGDLHSVYRPLVCFILQGAKRMTVGLDARVFHAGQSVIVAADMPVTGRIVEAAPDTPYLAVAVELEPGTLRELAAHMGAVRPVRPSQTRTLFVQDTDAALLDCARRLMQLLDRPEAAPLLAPLILRELHYWLLEGRHGAALRALTAPEGHAARLGAAIAVLRRDYRQRIPVETLAASAGMSPTAFHRHFKQMTSLTPGRYQQRLRLIEARRLIQDQGLTAGAAAFEVGYESVSQFTREYARLFQAPPKRDALRARRTGRVEDAPAAV
jgi:AraC-like DNA-binding protein